MRKRGGAAWLIGLAVLSLGAAWASRQPGEPLRCILPRRMDIQESVTLRGTLQERSRTEIASSRTALTEQVLVSVGQQVKSGELLAVLRPEEENPAPEAALTGLAGGFGLEDLLKKDDFKNVIFQGNAQDHLILITAPTDGTVMDQGLTPGETVHAYRPFITLSDLSEMRIKALVSEENIGKLKAGQQGKAKVEALGVSELPAQLEAVAPYAQPVGALGQTPVPRTEVSVLLTPNEALRPGYTASVKFVVDRHPQALTLPYSAVGRDGQGSFVWALSEEKLERRPIICGKELPDCVEILAGLDEKTAVLKDISVQKAEKDKSFT